MLNWRMGSRGGASCGQWSCPLGRGGIRAETGRDRELKGGFLLAQCPQGPPRMSKHIRPLQRAGGCPWGGELGVTSTLCCYEYQIPVNEGSFHCSLEMPCDIPAFDCGDLRQAVLCVFQHPDDVRRVNRSQAELLQRGLSHATKGHITGYA